MFMSLKTISVTTLSEGFKKADCNLIIVKRGFSFASAGLTKLPDSAGRRALTLNGNLAQDHVSGCQIWLQ